jgi:hypothetical protein|tara:strand:- start:64 stop:273 length:210 start_codon:yes stop_codon:yes gene_type:complete
MNKPKMPKDIPVVLNTKNGVLWKNVERVYEQRVEDNKIQAELDDVILKYAKEKVEKDAEDLKKELEKGS